MMETLEALMYFSLFDTFIAGVSLSVRVKLILNNAYLSF